MKTPSLKEAELALRTQNLEDVTVICCNCRSLLWKLEGFKRGYRTTKKISLDERVGRWSEYWSKDGKTPLKIECPICGENYFQSLEGPNGIRIPKIYTLEFDT